MVAENVTPLYSENLNRLRGLFQRIDRPYGLEDIRAFNSMYREIYPSLSREEKLRAELLVDTLIEGLERKEWASKIFGVV